MNAKTVLITGASRGIGKATAKYLVDAGYRLVLVGRNDKTVERLKSLDYISHSDSEVYKVDLNDLDSVQEFTRSFSDSLWGVVNNAGVCKTHFLEEKNDDPVYEIFNTNLYAPYLLVKGLLPNISTPGRIINIASQLGVEGRQGYSAYCASKFGLIGMTKCWAKELGGDGITVNAISPGWVDTEMSRIDMAKMAKDKGIDTDDFYKEICAPLELKRFNTTKEIASLVKYLLSEESCGITGRDWLLQTVWNQE